MFQFRSKNVEQGSSSTHLGLQHTACVMCEGDVELLPVQLKVKVPHVQHMSYMTQIGCILHARAATNNITCNSDDDSRSARGQTTSISLIIIRLATSLDTFCSAPAAEPQTVQSEDLQLIEHCSASYGCHEACSLTSLPAILRPYNTKFQT